MILQKTKEMLRNSLWIVPVLLGAAGALFAICLLLIESFFEEVLGFQLIKELSTRNLTTILSTILAAIVTVFGILMPVLFSILLRASNQYTPKVLRIYREALFPKLFLGLILAATLYLMTTLALINLFAWFVPRISMLVAFLLIILTIYSLPPFFDRLAKSMEPIYLIEVITSDLKKMLSKLETITSSTSQNALEVTQERDLLDINRYNYALAAPKSGYIQHIETPSILKLCIEEKIFAAIPTRPGDFILQGNPMLYLNKQKTPNKELVAKLERLFIIGDTRIDISDLELQLNEMLSIVVRALSPGVTDLFTAIECVNNVGSICNLLINRRMASGIHKDESGEVYLFTKEFDFFGVIHTAFDTVRQNLKGQPTIALQALHIIKGLVNNCLSKKRAEVLQEIAQQIVEESKTMHLDFDRDKMDVCLNSIKDICSNNNYSE